jgi:DNA-binding XRE family transcriptional regulator
VEEMNLSKPRRVRVPAKRKDKIDVFRIFPEEVSQIQSLIRLIKNLREEKGISQSTVCSTTGLSASTVSKIESEACGLNVRGVVSILRAFGYRMTFGCEKIDVQSS